jgi:hypothetical protein
MTETVMDPKTQIGLQTDGGVRKIRISDYQILKEEGILVQLDISGPSIFQAGLDWAEIGVSLESTRVAWMTPGRKYLYPKHLVNRLNSVISRMRQALQKYTHDLEGFRPYRYLHYKQYATWVETWAELLKEFNQIKADLIALYEPAVDEITEQYNLCARESFLAALSSGETSVIFNRHAYNDPDLFVDAVVSAVVSRVPTLDQIESEIHAAYHTAIIQGLDDLAREETRAQRLRAEAEEQVRAARLENEKLENEVSHAQEMQRIEEEGKRAQIEAMLHAEAESIRSKIEEAAGPLEQTFITLRQEMAQAAGEMLDSIQKNGHLHGRSAKRAVETLGELIDMRSLVDDAQLKEKFAELVNAIGPVGSNQAEERSTEDITAALESIQELVKSARADFSAQPSRFEFME